MALLEARNVDIYYGSTQIIHHLSFTPPTGKVTALIGPNGCGKSTLLKAFAHVLTPKSGQILLNQQSFSQLPVKELARNIGFLPQILPVPEGVTVRQLVSYGRSPHNGMWGKLNSTDHDYVNLALSRLGISEFAERLLADLSGGQRQRAWLAMVLAQNTPVVLLDEPTTYLDINHQIGLLKLMRALSQEGKSVVTVLHDINQACRYADHIAVMQKGKIVASGSPQEIMTAALVKQVFEVDVAIYPDPVSGTPMCIVKDA